MNELAKQSILKTKIDELKSGERTKKVFEESLQFPCEFTMKVIGENDSTFVNDVISKVARFKVPKMMLLCPFCV